MQSNLESPVLKAQQGCLDIVLELAKMLEPLYIEAEKSPYVKGCKLEVLPFNDGYEITGTLDIDYEYYYENYNYQTDDNRNKILSLAYLKNLRLCLEPDTFFNSDFKERSAQIECDEIGLSDKEKRVKQYKVKVMEDIRDIKIAVLKKAKYAIDMHMQNICKA